MRMNDWLAILNVLRSVTDEPKPYPRHRPSAAPLPPANFRHLPHRLSFWLHHLNPLSTSFPFRSS